MRIAILADIHGNLPALDAALERVKALSVDHLVIAGDVVVGSPDSLGCWERVRALGCPVLRGNHERYVTDLGTERAKPEWNTPQFGPVQFAARQLGEKNRRELVALPLVHRIKGVSDVLFMHASARNDSDLIFPYTSDGEITPMFTEVAERWLIRGHNHYAGVRLWGERRIVTVGSVGLPLDGTPAAQFTVLERTGDDWKIQHQKVPYDISLTLRRFHETGYLHEAGPMARLFMREVETAAFHILPFLKWQRESGLSEDKLPLAQAIDQFLAR